MKNHTLIYCGEDGNAGRALGNQIRERDSDNKVRLLSCEFFGGAEEAEHVIIMPDVPDHIGSVIRAAYPDIVSSVIASEKAITELAENADHLAAMVVAATAKRKPGRPRKAVA